MGVWLDIDWLGADWLDVDWLDVDWLHSHALHLFNPQLLLVGRERILYLTICTLQFFI
ncbi:MAG TPA: hypothetical protein VK142_03555 [Bacillota bacterium]|nr:hypothetical protein [Bacillota bacterium]